jgi:hypothetical protein
VSACQPCRVSLRPQRLCAALCRFLISSGPAAAAHGRKRTDSEPGGAPAAAAGGESARLLAGAAVAVAHSHDLAGESVTHRQLASTAVAGEARDADVACARRPGEVKAAAALPALGEERFTWRLWRLMRRPDVALFLAQACTMGFGFGVIDSFLWVRGCCLP